MTTPTRDFFSKSKDFSLNDDEGSLGGLNDTPRLKKPLVIVYMYLVFKSHAPSMVNFNFRVPPKTFISNQSLLNLYQITLN